MASSRADDVLQLLASAADMDYIGEGVSQLQHALQAARAARLRGCDDHVVIAALLHDIGHIVGMSDPQAKHMVDEDGKSLGIEGHEKIGAAYLRKMGFSEDVASMVGSHAHAKRYLVSTKASYHDKLSPASQQTLLQQGGIMSPQEVAEFEGDSLAAERVVLRLCDEEAKVPGWQVPGLETYRPLLERNIATAAASGTAAGGSRPQQQKLLFTPGPLNTSSAVKAAMQVDLGSRDAEFVAAVKQVRQQLLEVAGVAAGGQFTTVLMQGSGTFGNEAVIGSAVPRKGGRLLVPINGAYGARLADVAARLDIPVVPLEQPEHLPIDPAVFEAALQSAAADGQGPVTHVALVHCETSTGLVNDVQALGAVAAKAGASVIVDAMSSFGAVPLDLEAAHADFLVSSSNKCLQGVPGFSFTIARKEALLACKGNARSTSLDLFAQWEALEKPEGQFRFTPPTHSILAFHAAIQEFLAEGGVAARSARYKANQALLREGMAKMGFKEYLASEHQGYIITSFHYPEDPRFNFVDFYSALSARGCCIYPGKLSQAECFRIGSIGDLHPADMEKLLAAIAEVWPPKESAPAAANGTAPPAATNAASETTSAKTNGYAAGGVEDSAAANRVKAVVFDWAGTAIDFGSRAPLMAFLEMFKNYGVNIDEEEARRPMGLTKKQHIQELLDLPEVAAQLPSRATVDTLYEEFLKVQAATINQYTELIPGFVDAVAWLRSRRIKVGSTSGYSRFMIPGVVAAAAEQGYTPDVIVTADEVPSGRPSPYMAWSALQQMGVWEVGACVKVGDTVADVGEGLNAGMWAVGVTATGNEVGLSEAQLEALGPKERKAVLKKAADKLAAAGAHYVIEGPHELPAVIEHISTRIARGERP